jgi:hypothetical protein
MKTIKQIADELGVDKQRIYRFIRKNHISEAHRDAVVMWYDDAVVTLVTQHFIESSHIGDVHHEAHQTASSDAVVDTVITMLKVELEVKNEQIRELNLRLSETAAALVTAQQSAQAAQALHAGTMQQRMTDGRPEPTPAGARQRLWWRFWGRG